MKQFEDRKQASMFLGFLKIEYGDQYNIELYQHVKLLVLYNGKQNEGAPQGSFEPNPIKVGCHSSKIEVWASG